MRAYCEDEAVVTLGEHYHGLLAGCRRFDDQPLLLEEQLRSAQSHLSINAFAFTAESEISAA